MKKKKKNKYSTENVNEIRYRDFVNSYEAQKKLIRSFNLMDDTFFAAVMEDTTVCTYVLRIITGKNTEGPLGKCPVSFQKHTHTFSNP